MRAARLTILLAAALLGAAELVSLSILLRGLGEHQTQRVATALDRAAFLAPRIADWARTRGATPGETLVAAWLEPFEQLAVEDPLTLDLTPEDRRRVEAGELVVVSRLGDRVLGVVGLIRSEKGPIAFRLVETTGEMTRVASDRTLIGQHALILLCAVIGLVLAALAGDTRGGDSPSPALRAYEEAMSRLRLREDEQLAAFDREKLRLTSILRDREAMARAGELTAGIVHEVRNSLGAIATHAKFAEKAGEERVRSAAQAIGDEVRTLQSVMNRFLDFIRTEKVQTGDFDLARLVGRVAARERTNHAARIEMDGASTMVAGDEDLLERAIENVVRNAVQASGPGQVVSIKFGADETHAFVIVEDRGPGIKDVERALRPFESQRAGGLGLGLPLVLKILALHQGTLDLTPRPTGGGTQAVCRWPKASPDATSGNVPERA
jgi:signal transduction histidine kinase